MDKPSKEYFTPEKMPGHAIYSRAMLNDEGLDEPYRYYLTREWTADIASRHNLNGMVNFIMLNPSTATHKEWDPTVRRCAGYAFDWGYRELTVTNLFGLRSTDPQGLYDAERPVVHSDDVPLDPDGPFHDSNTKEILVTAKRADCVVCAWGNHGTFNNRGQTVLGLLREFCTPHALTITGKDQPGHPLYLSSSLTPTPIPNYCYE